MELILHHLGFKATKNADNARTVELLVIRNNDGTPRWIAPAKNTKPLFLKFYAVHNLKSAAFALAIRLIFLFGLQGLFFRIETFDVEEQDDNKILSFDLFSENWALFTGTPGPNNKFILFCQDSQGSRFLKIAVSPNSANLINNERNALNRVFSIWPIAFTTPNILNQTDRTLELEDVSRNVVRANKFSCAHFNALQEIYESTSILLPIEEVEDMNTLSARIAKLVEKNDGRLPKGMLKKLGTLANEMGNEEIEVALAHGDFTPWNMYKKQDKLVIYDWELSSPIMPIGFDAFHFIIQKGILTERKTWKEIKKELLNIITKENFNSLSKFGNPNVEQYLGYYLLINTVNYLEVYSEQTKWHIQINWLLNTWNEAITELLQESKSARELVILDLFDYLSSKRYAAIKFPCHSPEALSEYSDIDMCVEQKDIKPFVAYLASHPLVAHVNRHHQSFMDTVQIITTNGQFLSIDMIWTLKYKSLVMMDAKQALDTAYTNAYGVKMMDLKLQTRFIGLFYGLNNTNIPTKFQAYEQIIANSKEKVDHIIHCNMWDNTIRRDELLSCLLIEQTNQGTLKIINQFSYALDIVRRAIFNRGFIITFSGVDGAGKSTVIEKTKLEIEKKLRKTVVVLRHRPSVLPILSAWTKGKAQAEQEAASTLPRQGKNSSTLSSLMRFGYYYVDYVFGQFYVLAKYKMRGKVVLYDRYYFDFIVDSKRSNLAVPSWLVRLGYKLILKPELNFFLFADSATILNRKRELNKETIEELTAKYTKLFNELEGKKKARSTTYYVIENVDLNQTISTVITSTYSHAA